MSDNINIMSSMSNIPNIQNKDILNNIQKIYNNQKYFDIYGGSAVISILFAISVFSLFSYFHISKKFNKIRQNWSKYKCNPQVIPFAGIINKDPHKSVLDSTAVNFNGCVTNTLTEISSDFLQPIYYVTSTLQHITKSIVHDIQLIRTKIGSMVHNVESIDSEIMGRILNFMMPIRLMFMKIKDMISRTNATMVTSMYTALSTYLGIRSFIGAFAAIMGIGLAFALATAAVFNALIFTAPMAIPFEIIAGIIGAVLVFVGLLERDIISKTK